MITINPKTRKTTIIKSIEELVPHMRWVSKDWKNFTPKMEEQLTNLLKQDKTYSGLNLLYNELKLIFGIRHGTYKHDHYVNVLGWSEDETTKFLGNKGKLFTKSVGGLTPGMADFWVRFHGMTREEAVIKVSNMQSKISKRGHGPTVNQKVSLNYYTSRGMSLEDSKVAQSNEQKKRRNNCTEYWTSRGYSEDQAALEISKIQRKRSKLSMDYWLLRGHSEIEARELSRVQQKKSSVGRSSKISQKFFEELIEKLIPLGYLSSDFLYGSNEFSIFIEDNRRIYPDFTFMPSKRIIEFDGRYWHENRKDDDKYRDAKLIKLGYEVLRISETYNKDEWDKYLLQSIEFIKTGNNHATI